MTFSKIRLHISGQLAITGDERTVSEDMAQRCGIFGWVQKFFPAQTTYGSVQQRRTLWMWDDLLVSVDVEELCSNRTFPVLNGILLD